MNGKRLFACFTVLILLAVSLPLASFAETTATITCYDVLHLRSGPGSDYAILGRYRHGTRVTILSTGRRWDRVRTPDGKVGYMYKQYLSAYRTSDSSSSSRSSSGSSSRSSSGSSIGTGLRYIKTGIGPVNFRKNPNVNSALLDQLYGGTLVVVLSTRGEWARVRYNGTLGWIKTRYLVTTWK